MQSIERQLRIPGNSEFGIEATKILKPRYTSGLTRAALKPMLVDATLAQRLHSADYGDLLLLKPEFEGIDAGDEHISSKLTLEEAGDPLLRAGREQSVWGVRFGQLLMESPGMVPAQEYVAIKPTLIERAIHEAAAATLINTKADDDGVQTYHPLGFLRTAEGAALITRFAPQTISFDNILWANDDEATDHQVADALAKS